MTRARALRRLARTRALGVAVLRAVLAAAGAATATAGALLAAAPQLDHPWLNWIEAGVPALEDAFLTPTEREVRRDSARALIEARAQLAALSARQAAAQWEARPLDADGTERLRQFLAGRAEIAGGDRLVLATLRAKARERQRRWLGGPLAVAGVALAWAARRRRRRQAG